jgi:acyl-[acyl-carrier-protein] desaturase
VVFTRQALPAIRPVNHLIDDGRMIVRTRLVAKVAVTTRSHNNSDEVMAYEADERDPERRTVWSVVVTGIGASDLNVTRLHRYIACNCRTHTTGGYMANASTDLQLMTELEPVAERLLNRHISMFKEWNPHDYIPWSDGKNFYALGGQDWEPGQSQLSDVAQVAMVLNLLTEDNLPAYHREIAMNFGMDGPWGQWVNRWTAEENRHSTALRDYLVVTRAVDPVALEQLRLEQVTRGFSPGQNHQTDGDLFATSLFDSVIYVSFQELATRVSHRNTGKACDDTIADQLLARVSADENLHMIFYRDISDAGFQIAPNEAMRSLHKVLRNFKMPGYTVPGFRRKAVIIAVGGVFDPRIFLDDVVMPQLRKWRIFEREDFTGEAARMRDDLGLLVDELEEACAKFELSKQRHLEREARRAEKITANRVLSTTGTLTLSRK